MRQESSGISAKSPAICRQRLLTARQPTAILCEIRLIPLMNKIIPTANGATFSKLFGESLKVWRKNILKVEHAKAMHSRISQVAGELRERDIKVSDYGHGIISDWEKGVIRCPGSLVFDLIIPAYEIDDFVLFYAMGKASLEPGGLHLLKVGVGRHEAADSQIVRHSPSVSDFKGPFRIDHVEMKRGATTPWGPHDGHEFAMVLRGKFQFRHGDKTNPETIDLDRHDCIEFNSSANHQFKCLKTVNDGRSNSNKPGILVVAKTRRMPPKQL